MILHTCTATGFRIFSPGDFRGDRLHSPVPVITSPWRGLHGRAILRWRRLRRLVLLEGRSCAETFLSDIHQLRSGLEPKWLNLCFASPKSIHGRKKNHAFHYSERMLMKPSKYRDHLIVSEGNNCEGQVQLPKISTLYKAVRVWQNKYILYKADNVV